MLTCSLHKPFCAPLLALLLIASCNGQDKPVLSKDSLVGSGTVPAGKPAGTAPFGSAPWSGFVSFSTGGEQISQYIRRMFQDAAGNLWFGTEGGVSRFNGRTFTGFPIPAADLTNSPDVYPSPKLISSIVQDKAGNIWFGSNGGGVYRYDGSTLTNLSEKDGLCNNFVTSILEDRAGNLWFGTRFGGLCRYDGKAFTSLTRKDGLTSSFVWTLYEERAGTLWMGTAGGGACRTDGATLTCYGEQDGLGNLYVQSILEDASGQLWFGTSGGVYRFNGTTFTNFTKKDALRRGRLLRWTPKARPRAPAVLRRSRLLHGREW